MGRKKKEAEEKAEKKKRRRQKYKKDPRVNTTGMGWRLLLFFLLVFGVAIAESVYLMHWIVAHMSIFIVVGYYMILAALLIGFILVMIRWRFYGLPIRGLAEAARKVAAGDFTVRAKPNRKDGKKDEIGVLIEDFNKMAEELSRTEMLKTDFISNVSHEIKSPLAVITSYTKALKEEEMTDAERDQYLDTVLTASNNLSKLVSNILQLSKEENQPGQEKCEPYQLGEQLRHCALTFLDQWTEKEIDFRIDVEDVLVYYPPTAMEVVWNNLLSNAIKFTESGGMISLTSYLETDAVVVIVKDTGCGISEEGCRRIFDKFYQEDSSHATEGNGLGLALVSTILKNTGGSIAVESIQGEGSTFTVRLPRQHGIG